MSANLRSPIVPLLFATALCAAAAFSARAQSRRQPPPEAFTACESKKAGDACTADVHGQSLAGTCTAADDAKVFCRPTKMPRPPDGKPSGDRPPPDGEPPAGDLPPAPDGQ